MAGLVRDAERSWFVEFSGKGNFHFRIHTETFICSAKALLISDVASLYLIVVYIPQEPEHWNCEPIANFFTKTDMFPGHK